MEAQPLRNRAGGRFGLHRSQEEVSLCTQAKYFWVPVHGIMEHGTLKRQVETLMLVVPESFLGDVTLIPGKREDQKHEQQ